MRDPFSWDITGRNIFMMIIQGFLFFFITVMIEYQFFIPKRLVYIFIFNYAWLFPCFSPTVKATFTHYLTDFGLLIAEKEIY